jgi:hypothetical protein
VIWITRPVPVAVAVAMGLVCLLGAARASGGLAR